MYWLITITENSTHRQLFKNFLRMNTLWIVIPATKLWSVSHRCKVFGFMHCMFYSQKFPQCFQILTALLAEFLTPNYLPLQPHRPNDPSQCNVKHKGVEEPIYRCCTLYALRPRCNISGYLMSLLKRCDYFTSNKTCFITWLRT